MKTLYWTLALWAFTAMPALAGPVDRVKGVQEFARNQSSGSSNGLLIAVLVGLAVVAAISVALVAQKKR